MRARRTELGLSQEQLADECGLHWSYVGQVERGRRNLSLHNILKIAAGLLHEARRARLDPSRLALTLTHHSPGPSPGFSARRPAPDEVGRGQVHPPLPGRGTLGLCAVVRV